MRAQEGEGFDRALAAVEALRTELVQLSANQIPPRTPADGRCRPASISTQATTTHGGNFVIPPDRGSAMTVAPIPGVVNDQVDRNRINSECGRLAIDRALLRSAVWFYHLPLQLLRSGAGCGGNTRAGKEKQRCGHGSCDG
jgi:hypothetical protein